MTPDLYFVAGEAYMRLNRLEEAGHWYKESLRAKPDHIPAHLTYGKLLSIIVSPVTTHPPHGKNHEASQSIILVTTAAVYCLAERN